MGNLLSDATRASACNDYPAQVKLVVFEILIYLESCVVTIHHPPTSNFTITAAKFGCQFFKLILQLNDMIVVVAKRVLNTQVSRTANDVRSEGEDPDVCVGKDVVLPAEVIADLLVLLVLVLAVPADIGVVMVVLVDLGNDDRILLDRTSGPVVVVEY